MQRPEGIALRFSPPAIPGVGTSGGFTFVLEDRSGKDIQFLASNLSTFLAALRKRPEIGFAASTLLRSVPHQFVKVDRQQAIKQGSSATDLHQTLPVFI